MVKKSKLWYWRKRLACAASRLCRVSLVPATFRLSGTGASVHLCGVTPFFKSFSSQVFPFFCLDQPGGGGVTKETKKQGGELLDGVAENTLFPSTNSRPVIGRR